MKGYVQVYTGKGKGKTTAAFGLALRAAGAGLKVYLAQFVKGTKYSECYAVEKHLSEFITLKQYGMGYFIEREPNEEDRRIASEGLQEIKEIMCSRKFDIIILDEANIAVYYKLFSAEDLLDFISEKPENIELIITGRHADPKIIDRADLVTEMKEIKHYYKQGVEARKGIEK